MECKSAKKTDKVQRPKVTNATNLTKNIGNVRGIQVPGKNLKLSSQPSKELSNSTGTLNTKRKGQNVTEEQKVHVTKQDKNENDITETNCERKDIEENFIDDLKSNGLLKTSPYMLHKNRLVRYDVGGEILEGKDLSTLQGSSWLNDKVINAYMGILKSEQNLEQEGHIFALPSYMAVLWEQKRFNTWFYSKVKFSRYTWIFMPINKCQNHWILLAANIQCKSVSILDSMNGNNDKYVQHWRNYMKIRSKKIKDDVDGNWKNGNLKSSQQKDGHSCGPFILMNALALSQGIEPIQLTQKAALVMREHVTNKIIETSRKPKAQRTICDMLDCQKPIKDAWVQCEVCGRWLHFKCIGLKTAPKNDYVCIVCESQYK